MFLAVWVSKCTFNRLKFWSEKSWILCIISLPGICSAAVTSSTWAATLATVETTIATATSELSGLDALANGLTGKMMDHYCADF